MAFRYYAGADQMSIMEAVIVGGIGGIVVVLAFSLDKLKLDDPVGAVAVHLFTGMWVLLLSEFSVSSPLGISLWYN